MLPNNSARQIARFKPICPAISVELPAEFRAATGHLMRLLHAVLLLAVTASPAFAQREPLIVIPGKPGVPVYINGIDASWGVVEGEFGLDRPGLVAPTVIYRPLVVSVPSAAFPAIIPRDGKRPATAGLKSFRRPSAAAAAGADLLSQLVEPSAPGPVTDYPPYPAPPIVDRRLSQAGQRRINSGTEATTSVNGHRCAAGRTTGLPVSASSSGSVE